MPSTKPVGAGGANGHALDHVDARGLELPPPQLVHQARCAHQRAEPEERQRGPGHAVRGVRVQHEHCGDTKRQADARPCAVLQSWPRPAAAPHAAHLLGPRSEHRGECVGFVRTSEGSARRGNDCAATSHARLAGRTGRTGRPLAGQVVLSGGSRRSSRSRDDGPCAAARSGAAVAARTRGLIRGKPDAGSAAEPAAVLGPGSREGVKSRRVKAATGRYRA